MQTNVTTKLIKISVRDLPPLHSYVLLHKNVLADISYVVKLPSSISQMGIRTTLLCSPIIIVNTGAGKYTIGGFRSWTLCKQILDATAKIQVIELYVPHDEAIKAFAISFIFANQLVYEPQKSSLLLLEQALEKLSQEDRAIFSALLPGAASNKRYTEVTGIREGTLYHRKNRSSSQTHDEEDNDE
jgi:hypothetical protein